MQLPIYMDHHATTPVDPGVLEAMLPYFRQRFGNASSKSHAFGWIAEEAVEVARDQVAALIGSQGSEIIFTSGATESNNLAIKGVAGAYHGKGKHIITSATEHKAVLDPCAHLRSEGFSVTVLPVNGHGLIDVQQLRAALRKDTILVSIMMANNEVGSIAPIADVGRVTREAGVLFHTDAAQAVGKIPIDVQEMRIDLLSFSSHKMYGPKGAGGLFVRRRAPRVRLLPGMHGGGHQNGMRSGTLNVPGIVGTGAACEIAGRSMREEAERTAELRDMLQGLICEALDDVTVNGHPHMRLPGNLHLSFGGIKADAVIAKMTDIAVSTGSACTSSTAEPSHVLRAMGLTRDMTLAGIRFGLGRWTTREEVAYTADKLVKTVRRLRRDRPV